MWKAAFTPASDNHPQPARPLALVRILVGSATLLQLPRLFSQLTRLLAPGAFRAPYAISPTLAPSAAPILVWLMVALAIAAIVGWHTRIALASLAASLAFVLALDQQLYRNDLWLLFLECFLLSLADSGAALSLDARRADDREVDAGRTDAKEFVERWPVLLLKIQLTIVYAFSAMSKVNGAFLRGDIVQSALRFDDVPLKLIVFVSVLAIATELFLAVGLWFTRTRRYAMLVGFLLHASFVVLLESGPILVAFGVEMLALYTLFPEIRQGEYVVLYDVRSRITLIFVKWCRRLDWLRVYSFQPSSAHGQNAFVELESRPGGRRFSGFEAIREIVQWLPATWFLAPVLYLPGVTTLGNRLRCALIARQRSQISADGYTPN